MKESYNFLVRYFKDPLVVGNRNPFKLAEVKGILCME